MQCEMQSGKSVNRGIGVPDKLNAVVVRLCVVVGV